MKIDLRRNGLEPHAELKHIDPYKNSDGNWRFDLAYRISFDDGYSYTLSIYGLQSPFPEANFLYLSEYDRPSVGPVNRAKVYSYAAWESLDFDSFRISEVNDPNLPLEVTLDDIEKMFGRKVRIIK